VLIFPLKQMGLALATSLAAMLNSMLLLWILKRQQLLVVEPSFLRILAAGINANLIMAGMLYFLQGSLSVWLQWAAWERALHLTYLIGCGILLYFGTLVLLGIRKRDFVI